jgi:hypothetical protein
MRNWHCANRFEIRHLEDNRQRPPASRRSLICFYPPLRRQEQLSDAVERELVTRLCKCVVGLSPPLLAV